MDLLQRCTANRQNTVSYRLRLELLEGSLTNCLKTCSLIRSRLRYNIETTLVTSSRAVLGVNLEVSAVRNKSDLYK